MPKLIRNTYAGWVSSNPVLALEDTGFERDTGRSKIGDGVRAWNDLPYLGETTDLQVEIDEKTAKASLLDYGLLRPGWVPASWRQGLPGFSGNSGIVNTNSNMRLLHPLNSEVHEFRLVYWNNHTNDITVRAALEIAGVVIVPVFFNGQRDVTIPAGHTTVVISDPIPMRALANANLYSRTKVSVAAGGGWRLNYSTFQSGETVENETGSTDRTLTGNNTGTGFGYGPAMILGFVAKRKPFVAVFGDSITALLPPFANGYSDTWHRLVLGSLSYVAIGQGGAQVTSFNAPMFPSLSGITGYPLGRSLSNGASHVLLAFATNDIFTAALSLETLKVNFLTAWNSLAAQGKKVYAVTSVPRTTSTDSWATVDNQTTTSVAQEQVRKAFNAWIRTIPAPLSGYFDWADAVESARDSGKWKAAHTVDGVHPNAASGIGHTAFKNVMNPAVFTL